VLTQVYYYYYYYYYYYITADNWINSVWPKVQDTALQKSWQLNIWFSDSKLNAIDKLTTGSPRS